VDAAEVACLLGELPDLVQALRIAEEESVLIEPACRPLVHPPRLAKDVDLEVAVDLDDVLIYALYPVTGKRFLKWKYGKEEPPAEVRPRSLEQAKKEEEMVRKARAGQLVEKSAKKQGPPKSDDVRTFNVYVGDEYFEVGVDEVGESPVLSYIQQMPAMPAGQMMPAMPAAAPAQRPAAPAAAPAAPAPAKEEAAAAPAPAAAEVEGTPLIAPMPGMIVNFQKKVGDEVSEGETVVILEAMKMENALPAPTGGTIKAINFSSGDSVQKNDVLAVIG
jgi:oxaloacetate decarboxylase alpha subunit/pyruvate carboxylase subunit B